MVLKLVASDLCSLYCEKNGVTRSLYETEVFKPTWKADWMNATVI